MLRVLHNPRYASAFVYGRYAHQPKPNGKSSSVKLPREQWVSFIPDGIVAAEKLGAARDVMEDVWWGPTIPLPNGPWFALSERNAPGSIIVNTAGQRYMNEALPHGGHPSPYGGTYGQEPPGENLPSWMIIDQQRRDRYLFAGLQGGQRIPRKWLESDAVVTADTIAELAEKVGIDRSRGLGANHLTVQRLRAQRRRPGLPPRRERPRQVLSDPTHKPDPSPGEITHPPYYAVKMVPGNLGTKGGVRTDVHARALRDDTSLIEGLYAAGNVSAPVMGLTYPGPGGTIGPTTMTFGYLAALHIAGAARPATSSTGMEGMPIDLDTAIGAELEPSEFSWTSGDVQLYHLGLGAGAGAGAMNPRELRYLVDDTPQVLPAFGNVAASFHITEPPKVHFPDVDIELSKALHASEAVTVPAPLPASGSAQSVQRSTQMWEGQGRGDRQRNNGDTPTARCCGPPNGRSSRPRRGRLRR